VVRSASARGRAASARERVVAVVVVGAQTWGGGPHPRSIFSGSAEGGGEGESGGSTGKAGGGEKARGAKEGGEATTQPGRQEGRGRRRRRGARRPPCARPRARPRAWPCVSGMYCYSTGQLSMVRSKASSFMAEGMSSRDGEREGCVRFELRRGEKEVDRASV
jgi:hypothetical protein